MTLIAREAEITIQLTGIKARFLYHEENQQQAIQYRLYDNKTVLNITIEDIRKDAQRLSAVADEIEKAHKICIS